MIAKLLPFLGKLFSPKPSPPPRERAPRKQAPRIGKTISPEKQAALDKLCAQLLSKKTLITSGKLQFMGLGKIKKKLGKEWAGLSKIVYGTVEEVLDKHLDPTDLYIRYHDEAYVILFARCTKEEGEAKARLAADEIRERLFALDEEDLRTMEIRQAVSELKPASFSDNAFNDFLDAFAIDFVDAPLQEEKKEEGTRLFSGDMARLDIDAGKPVKKMKSGETAFAPLPLDLAYSYLPMWDVRRNALTTYLCLAHPPDEKDVFHAYKEICKGQSPENMTAMDIQMLQSVMRELAAMAKDGRKLLIACPVQIETLHNFTSYEEYKLVLHEIPQDHRQYLVFLVMNMNDATPEKDTYWFAAPLRGYCRHVFVEVPLQKDINFNYLRNSGVDVAGIRLDGTGMSEAEVMNIMNNFSAKAKTFKIPQTFVLGVSTLSMTTSSVCAGFNYLGGSAIHDPVARPDDVHRYRHEDLLKHLIPEFH